MTIFNLDWLKAIGADPIPLRSYDSKMLLEVINSWPLIRSKYDPKEDHMDEYLSIEDKHKWVWAHTDFDFMEWCESSGHVLMRTLIVSLMKANVIYPDGTVNQDYVSKLNPNPKKEK